MKGVSPSFARLYPKLEEIPDMPIQFIRQLRPIWRLKKLKFYQLLQDHFDIAIFIRLPGIKFHVAIMFLRDLTWFIRSFGIRTNVESYQVEFLFDKILKISNLSVFWDVGANIGLYSWKALSTPSIQEVVLFEADSKNYKLLQKTVQKNNFKKAKIKHVAVSNVNGTIDFLVDNMTGATGCIKSDSLTSSSISLHQDYNLEKTISVQSITLDSLTENGFSPPDIIKVDVEGAEGLVLEGSVNLIREYMPLLIVETGDQHIIANLKNLGYRIISLDKSNIVFIPPRYNYLHEETLTE